MAKLKVETNRDTELVKYSSLLIGEVFIYKGEVCMKTEDTSTAVRLNDGWFRTFSDSGDVLVTCVRKAELKLTI